MIYLAEKSGNPQDGTEMPEFLRTCFDLWRLNVGLLWTFSVPCPDLESEPPTVDGGSSAQPDVPYTLGITLSSGCYPQPKTLNPNW